jgi:hypothetical protein
MTQRRWASTTGRARRIGVLCGVVALVAGCTSTITGASALEAGFKPGDPVPGLMDPGNYPTTPHAAYGAAGAGGVIVEGQRMADFVVGPWEVDPQLVDSVPHGSLVWKDAASLTNNLLGTARGSIAGAHGFVVGFSSSRTSTPPGQIKSLANVVLRFPTPADATAAAAEMGMPLPASDNGIGDTAEVPIPIPGHPDASATTHTAGTDGGAVVSSFTAHGPFVFYDLATAQGGDVGTAAALVAKAIDLQGPRIDGFAPTDPANLDDLPLDPTGLAARTLPLSKNAAATVYQGVWGPYGSLHFAVDPVKAAPVNVEAGVLRRSYLTSMVWETKDAAGAQRLLRSFLAEDADSTAKPTDGVAGLPSAKCSSSATDDPSQPSLVCYYAVDRYVVDVASRQDVDIQQQAAAQYLILTAK